MEQITRPKKRQLIRHSSEAVTEIISEYRKGQQTVKEFCAAKGINPGTFYCWLSKRRSNKRPKGSPAFVPVTIKEELQPEESMFAEYKGLKFYHAVSVEFLKALID